MQGRENPQVGFDYPVVCAMRHRALKCFRGNSDHLKDVLFKS